MFVWICLIVLMRFDSFFSVKYLYCIGIMMLCVVYRLFSVSSDSVGG